MSTRRTRRTWTSIVAVLALGLAAPLAGAQAASATPLAAGTYTVTANLYVAASSTPLGKNAYVTNPGKPPMNPPTSPATANATLQVLANGTKLLTVPVVNTTFGVLTIAGTSTAGTVSVTNTTTASWATTWGGTKQRITSVTFDVTAFAGGSAVATFQPSTEYADFLLYVGNKSWDLNLVVDFDSAS